MFHIYSSFYFINLIIYYIFAFHNILDLIILSNNTFFLILFYCMHPSGFEPAVSFSRDGLWVRCLRPLGHRCKKFSFGAGGIWTHVHYRLYNIFIHKLSLMRNLKQICLFFCRFSLEFFLFLIFSIIYVYFLANSFNIYANA